MTTIIYNRGDLVFWKTPALSGFRIVVEVWNDNLLPQLLVKIPFEDGKTFMVMQADCRLATEEETIKVSTSVADKNSKREKTTLAQYKEAVRKRQELGEDMTGNVVNDV